MCIRDSSGKAVWLPNVHALDRIPLVDKICDLDHCRIPFVEIGLGRDAPLSLRMISHDLYPQGEVLE